MKILFCDILIFHTWFVINRWVSEYADIHTHTQHKCFRSVEQNVEFIDLQQRWHLKNVYYVIIQKYNVISSSGVFIIQHWQRISILKLFLTHLRYWGKYAVALMLPCIVYEIINIEWLYLIYRYSYGHYKYIMFFKYMTDFILVSGGVHRMLIK